jgi:hypothetical protein
MNPRDLQPLLDTQQNQLGVVLDISASIDNKALALLGSNLTILIYIGSAFSQPPQWQWALLLSPFFVSLYFDIVAAWPRSYHGPGVNLAHHPEYVKMDTDALLLQLLADTKHAITHNSRLNNRRLAYCVMSLAATIAGSVVLFVMLGVY